MTGRGVSGRSIPGWHLRAWPPRACRRRPASPAAGWAPLACCAGAARPAAPRVSGARTRGGRPRGAGSAAAGPGAPGPAAAAGPGAPGPGQRAPGRRLPRSQPGRPPGPSGAVSAALSVPLLMAFQAASAACCSASFFERPDPDPYARPPTRTVARKNFWWSGPLSSTWYSGTPRKPEAVSSCREVFQSSPAPSPAERSMTGSNSRCTRLCAATRPHSWYTAPIRASSVSARIDDLSRPPVPSSPRPSRT